MKEIVLNGFEHAFFPGDFQQKKHYIDQASAFYDYVAAQYEIKKPAIAETAGDFKRRISQSH